MNKTLSQLIADLIAQYGREAVAAAVGALTPKTCLRCGNEWTPRKPGRPCQCTRCKSAYWDTARGADAC